MLLLNAVFLTEFNVLEPDFGFLTILCIVSFFAIIGIIALIDLFLNKFKNSNQRLFWLVAVVLTAGSAGLFYLYQRKKLILVGK